MRAAYDLRTDERGFGMESIGVNAFDFIPAEVVVPVPRGSGETRHVYSVFLHSRKNFTLIVFGDFVYFIESAI